MMPITTGLSVFPVGYDSTVALYVSGELDLHSVPDLEGAVREAQEQSPRLLVLDLTGLGFMDSAGVHLLLRTREWALESGHRLLIVPNPRVRRVLDLSGVSALFDDPGSGESPAA